MYILFADINCILIIQIDSKINEICRKTVDLKSSCGRDTQKQTCARHNNGFCRWARIYFYVMDINQQGSRIEARDQRGKFPTLVLPFDDNCNVSCSKFSFLCVFPYTFTNTQYDLINQSVECIFTLSVTSQAAPRQGGPIQLTPTSNISIIPLFSCLVFFALSHVCVCITIEY